VDGLCRRDGELALARLVLAGFICVAALMIAVVENVLSGH